jgi:hypothetical protein
MKGVAEEQIVYSAPLDLFDFERMARAMALLRWRWGMPGNRHIPKADELRARAAELLNSAKTSHSGEVSGGGLRAFRSGVIAFDRTCESRNRVLTAWKAAASPS